MAERVVEISLRIRMINDFDTTAQQCMANMHLVLRWEAPSTETMPTEEILEWEPMWKPRFRIKHLLELVHEQQMFSIVGKNVIEADYFLLCRVRQPLSLRMFPFDAQQLTFEIELLRDCNVVRFQAPEGIPAADVLKEKVFLSDFSLDEKVSHNYRLYFTSKGKSRRKRSYSGLILWVYLQRNPSFYMWNVAFIMFLIISSSLFAFAVNPIQIADRQAVDFSVILTAIAFKTAFGLLLTYALRSILATFIGGVEFWESTCSARAVGVADGGHADRGGGAEGGGGASGGTRPGANAFAHEKGQTPAVPRLRGLVDDDGAKTNPEAVRVRIINALHVEAQPLQRTAAIMGVHEGGLLVESQ
ncbi:hypothetical protein CYMTET_50574 [Cymbomonas tetramitiformis]|uniref:Uncharacterized protein n=1 Tax=Cymbomonas tetramitiformis TaxID=36881 RepID=A0AAE0ETC3_9CHLO|nr:hypothetical protein CYMTET_50574 [Cymbomonas tetramitiformis]